MQIPQVSLKAVIALALVLGTAALMLLLGAGHALPTDNKDLLNIVLGSWLTWGAIAVKRLFEGSDGSDQKNETINAQAKALSASQGPGAPS